jgi:diamine N-acetyltransferase
MFIKAENSALRALEPKDADLLYDWENNRALWSYSFTTVPFSKFVMSAFVEAAQQDLYGNRQLRLMLVSHDNTETFGCLDIFDFDPQHQRCGLGIYVHEQYRGKGLAAECLAMGLNYLFQTLLLKQVYAEVSESNLASLAVFEKLAFRRVGLKHSWHRTASNTFENVWLLQLLNPA